MTLRTRTRYKLVGSDYSAQQPRMTTFLSGQPVMYEAYNTGKDLYAMIAQSAFNNNYWDNLEFYKEFTEVDVGENQIVAGSGKKFEMTTDAENSITIPWCYLIETDRGELAAQFITTADKIKAGDEFIEILDIQSAGEVVVDGSTVKNIKIILKI